MFEQKNARTHENVEIFVYNDIFIPKTTKIQKKSRKINSHFHLRFLPDSNQQPLPFSGHGH